MAQIGDLVVTGSSRFLNPIYSSVFVAGDSLAVTPSDVTFASSTAGTWDGTNISLKSALTSAKQTTMSYINTYVSSQHRLLYAPGTDTATETGIPRKTSYLMYDEGSHALTLGNRLANQTYGYRSLSAGIDNIASQSCSYAFGNGCEASGSSCSYAEGYYAKATNAYAHAEGYKTTASGIESHAEGNQTTASADHTHAEGYLTVASGSCAHAEGYKTTASEYCAHAEGEETTASADSAHSEGYKTKATKNAAHAEGYSSEANGAYSHAEGYYTKVTGTYGHAEGRACQAGTEAHAEGGATTASGNGSHSEGGSTKATGGQSHAEGYGSEANGVYSHAEGYYTIASHKCQHTFGEWNIADTSTATASDRGTYIEIVGNGTASNARANARTLNWNGNEWIKGTLTQGSSIEIKKNVADMTQEDGDKILTLRPVVFDYKTSEKDTQAERGFIAEEVKEIIPNLVTDKIVNNDGDTVAPASLNYIAMIPYLVKVCQRQQQEIDELKKALNNK